MKTEWFASARAELAANPRLRIGIVCIGALLLMYQLAGLSDLRTRLESDYQAQQARLVRVQGISREDSWDQRASAIHVIRQGLEAQIPDADSVGLAQATMQGWLRDAATHVDADLSIAMGTPMPAAEGSPYWKIPAQVSASQIPVSRALELIRQIEDRKELMTVQSIRLTSGDHPSLALDVASYYRIPQKRAAHATP